MSIHAWLIENKIKNEKGDLIEFDNHPFLFDIYADNSKDLTIMKAAQVGLTTAEFLKSFYDSKHYKMDIIYCVDDKTEILTKRGFLFNDELTLKDKILTIDKKGNIQWSKMNEIFRKYVDMECVEFSGRNFNALVTPNHRWILKKYRGEGEMFFKETKDIIGKYYKIPKSLEHNGATVKKKIYDDDYIKLLAWIFSEGCYQKQAKGSGKKSYGITITQSQKMNEKYCQEIRDIFKKLNIKHKEYLLKNGEIINFSFAFKEGKEIKKRFPNKEPDIKFINSLTREQCKIFIETFVKGDGWIDRYGTSAITQKSKQTTEMLYIAGLYAGFVPSLQSSKKNLYTLRYTKYKTVHTAELNPKFVNYKGIIWCPNTKYGTFYARRNGRGYWTGNTLPTDNDVKVMVGGKFNRIIAMNSCMLKDVADKDSVEQKKVGDSMIYFRGTFTKKAAMMIPADRLMHDEKDTSKLDIIADYQARLQHSKFKQTHTFSHPSLPETGVHSDWLLSDQKHWFIECPHCNKKQFLNWDIENPNKMSICLERQIFQCKKCKKEIPDYVRKLGRWVAKYPKREKSGYWVPLLIAPWVSAKELIEKYHHPDTTKEFFFTKILGIPFADATSKLLRDAFFQNLTQKRWNPDTNERVVIGIDTGLRIDYVMGNEHGLFHHADTDDYGELNDIMERWPNAIAVIDAGGDLIGSRKFFARWPGRVFICSLSGDRKTMELAKWGTGDDYGNVIADRNRCIQLVVDEFREARIPVHGTQGDWFSYWSDWNNLAKTKILDPLTNAEKGYKWVRSGRDHLALATVFWRIGMMNFAGMGDIVENSTNKKPNSYVIDPDNKVRFNPKDILNNEDEDDWRIVD